MTVTISIIIPAWKEKNLDNIANLYKDMPGVEVICALARGDDVTPEPGGTMIVRAAKGRAAQMNAGAGLASGDILLFLHADTVITQESLSVVREVLQLPPVAGGAYMLKIDSPSAWLWLVSVVANIRSRVFSAPYGDQALFVSREWFDKIGGYQDTPILEDVMLVEQIRNRGKLKIIDEYAITSARRWRERGMVRSTLVNWAIMLGYYLGVSPDKLVKTFKR